MTDKKKQGGPAYAPLPPRYYIFGNYDVWDKAQMLKYADDTHELRMRALQAEPEAAPQQATSPTADVVEKMISNTWDHFGDILPTLKAVSRGEWYWGANQRCKYIEIRIDTQDGGCLLFDSKRVRISPEQFAHQSYQVGKMGPWSHRNAPDAAPAAKFKVGDLVTKTKGSQWTGRVVGTYSTTLTPEGYAVESSTERGSVQIYPAAALELVEEAQAEQTFITSESGTPQAEQSVITSESGTPPAEQEAQAEQSVITSEYGTPQAEQQAQPSAVDRTGCTAGTDEECTRRGCATSCPAQQAAPKAAPVEREQAAQRLRELAGIPQEDVTDPLHPRYIEGYKAGHAAGRKRAAPQQEAQEPVAWLNPWRADKVTTDYDAYGERGIPLYTAPQPAPAPLSEMPYEKRKAIQEGEQIGASDAWFKARHEMLDTLDRRNVFRAGFDSGWSAALAAQGGK